MNTTGAMEKQSTDQTKKVFDNKPWDVQLQNLLVLVVAVNIIPHGWQVPYWASLTGLACILWKLAYLNRGTQLPGRLWLAVGAFVASVGTYFEFHSLIGVEPASALLVILSSLKLLETNRYRDAMLVIFTSYFLLMAHLLISQSLISTIFMAFDILFITVLMFHLHKRDRRRSVRSFRPAMKMFALVFPMWVLFFFIFPRFTAAFWGSSTPSAGTGFSDNLNPGSIEQLASSDEPAFRVIFSGDQVKADRLYWRGAVLSISDGLHWSKKVGDEVSWLKSVSPAHFLDNKHSTSYEIYLEPGFQKWLFVLDYIKKFRAGELLSSLGLQHTEGFTYRTLHEHQSRISYSAISTDEAPLQELSIPERKVSLQLPPKLTDRTLALAATLKSKVSSSNGTDHRAEDLAKTVLNYFEDENFRYTMKPGSLKSIEGTVQLDDFLFQRKRGFCEHYAAAFSTLMRIMGIPTRVVVGFQGGKYNEYGKYLLVRHLDAHAWAEIWTENDKKIGRWMRIDPTETIAPLRLQLGGDFNRLDPQELEAGSGGDGLHGRLGSSLNRLSSRLLAAWDAAQMRWNAFLINYDLSFQLELLERLGIKNGSVLLLIALLALVLAFFGALLVLILRRKARRHDPVQTSWNQFCSRLNKSGLKRKLNEGPLDFSQRAAQDQPAVSEKIRTIAAIYIDLRYNELTAAERVEKTKLLRRQVRRFSIPSRSFSNSREVES